MVVLCPALSTTVATRSLPFMTLNTKVWFGFAPSPVTVLVIVRLQVLTLMVNCFSTLAVFVMLPVFGVEVLVTV